MTYIGIDLHSTNMVLVAINSKNDVIKEAEVTASPASLEKFFESIDRPG